MPFDIGNICNSNGPPFCVFKTYHFCQLILIKKCPLLFSTVLQNFNFAFEKPSDILRKFPYYIHHFK